jgi:diadenosine tetraphosphate (Ap4A) HIT family hydrolase
MLKGVIQTITKGHFLVIPKQKCLKLTGKSKYTIKFGILY